MVVAMASGSNRWTGRFFMFWGIERLVEERRAVKWLGQWSCPSIGSALQ
jgi:hypothetical protein